MDRYDPRWAPNSKTAPNVVQHRLWLTFKTNTVLRVFKMRLNGDKGLGKDGQKKAIKISNSSMSWLMLTNESHQTIIVDETTIFYKEPIISSIIDYFQKLYSANFWDRLPIVGLPHDASLIDEPFTEEEIMSAVWDLCEDSAPGLNDFLEVFLGSCER